jgi:tetratricopeptide (TPR) repeat protein
MKILLMLPIILIFSSACQGSTETIKLEGTAVEDFQRVGAWGWEVNVTKVINGSDELQGRMISVYLTSANPAEYPPGFLDPDIESSDSVEIYGEVDYCDPDWNCAILLTGSPDYYLKRTDAVIAEQENETSEYTINPDVYNISDTNSDNTATASANNELPSSYTGLTSDMTSQPNISDMFNIPALSNLTSNLNATANIILFPNMTINLIVIQNTTMNDFLVPTIDVMAKSPLDLMAATRNVTNSYDANTWYNKGTSFVKQGKYDEAIKAFDKVIGIDPTSVEALIGKAIAFFALGKYDETIQVCNKAIELNPQDANAWNNKGAALTAQTKYDEAVQAYDKAILLNPQDATAWIGKGSALCMQSKYDDAIQAYDRAIELDQSYVETWNNKGFVLYNQGKYDKAVQAYNNAIQLDPKDAEPWHNKGVALNAQGKYDEAIQVFDKVIQLNPNYTKTRTTKESCQLHKNKIHAT